MLNSHYLILLRLKFCVSGDSLPGREFFVLEKREDGRASWVTRGLRDL